MTQAVEFGWADLSTSERSSHYEKWASDPEIISALSPHIPRERIRVWIKDGPMKEYVRARRGIGSYARFVPRAEDFEGQIISRVLGEGWELTPGSVEVKPMRFIALNAELEDKCTVLWGSKPDLKHIVWAYLNMPETTNVKLVFLATPQEPISANDENHMNKIAARISTQFYYVSR